MNKREFLLVIGLILSMQHFCSTQISRIAKHSRFVIGFIGTKIPTELNAGLGDRWKMLLDV